MAKSAAGPNHDFEVVQTTLLMLTNQRLFPVTLGFYSRYASSSMIGAPQDVIGMVVTEVLISVIPLVIAFLALQNYWRGGVAVGAVRG